MKTITCVLLQREERDVLIRASTCIGVGAPSEEQAAEDKRRWNALLQRHEVLTYEVVERGQIIALRTLRQCEYEANPVYWTSQLPSPATPAGEHMIKVITESRRRMVHDLNAALLVLDLAVATATPRPFRDDLEDGEGN